MFDLLETDLKPGSGKPTGVTPDRDAKDRAMAVESGMKWKCSRVGAWVNLGDCMARYVQARDAQPSFHCVCLECASIDAHIRKHGITIQTQTAKQEPEAVATKPKAKPVEQEPSAESNPFAGWEQYRKEVRYNTGKAAYAAITKAHVLHFSAKAVVQHGLTRFKSVDVFYAGGKLGLVFRQDEKSGELKVTRKAKTETQGLHVSLRGVVKHYGLENSAGKRFQMVPLGDGVIEIELEKGTVAA